jgi:LmbE family N-acetylglucosaminyl deacetylase
MSALVLVLGLVSTPLTAVAQTMDGTGAVATGLLLRQMDGVKRVLMIAAHPDDEDTSLLTTLSRGWGAETAYLALTRGDGGQNLIGPELWEGLGIVRTGELVAARRLDGGRQFFTRAFDYGYSKSADEALSLWPRDELLRDVVWVVRSFRPHVIVTVFTGTPRDGHGQHQAAGIMAREVFAAAGDPDRYPEQLSLGVEAWQPLKLYQSSRRRFMPDLEDGSLDVATGVHDPLLGRSLFQLAMESRSQHRSQDMGAPQPLGPSTAGVILEESRVEDSGQEIFSGIDTTLVGVTVGLPPEVADEAGGHLESYRVAVQRAADGFGLDPQQIVPHLREAAIHLDSARLSAGDQADTEFQLVVSSKRALVDQAVMAASGIVYDVRSSDDLVVPGQTTRVTAQLWNGGSGTLWWAVEPELVVPEGWSARVVEREGVTGRELQPGTLAEWVFEVAVPEDASISRMYYLREQRDGAVYRWPDESELWGLPRDPAPVRGSVHFGLMWPAGGRPPFERPWEPRYEAAASWRYVGVDPAKGEFEKPVLVVPEVSVRVAPAGVTWPQGREGSGTVTVVVRGEAEAGSRGTVSVSPPSGWEVEPAAQHFDLNEAGAERAMTFEVRPTGEPEAGRHEFAVRAEAEDGRVFAEGYSLVDYDHIQRTALYAASVATISVVPVRARAGLRVGYIMGSGDDGPEAIRQMGAEVELLDEARVRDGDFGSFSTIVLGVRAYETRADLQAAADQLLDFARGGGTVIVQYNRGPLGSLAPFALQTGRGSPRVADETAPVRILSPEAPVFTTPNPIGDSDFDGWVQERGLYFAAEWDAQYVPLLELNDPGEPAHQGSLLVTTVGDGVFAYTALSFFRQWADQVPGAYRLFANLISLDAAEWRAFVTGR